MRVDGDEMTKVEKYEDWCNSSFIWNMILRRMKPKVKVIDGRHKGKTGEVYHVEQSLWITDLYIKTKDGDLLFGVPASDVKIIGKQPKVCYIGKGKWEVR